ncbi:unnamed protein product [Miscanthus lutarioriparius]|uniref:Uncharacterized protein n=1 Tax=Miscanthus lutarioriparius TaxID=422564 RepID=A0A811NMZ9_9POAL|nr:unnamed protein product [Miscanthus lutarioriparius]
MSTTSGGKPLVTAITKDAATKLYTAPLKDAQPLVLDLSGPLLWSTCAAAHPSYECHHAACADAQAHHPPGYPRTGHDVADESNPLRCRMESAVFVWPMHILTALYRDLVGRGRRGHGFMIEHNKLVENDGELDKLKVKIHCRTTLVPGVRIDLEVSGESRRGFDADCTAIIAVVEALRMQYGIFPADYSYAVIAEKRGIFNEMGAALEGFINAYFEMDDSIAGYHSSIINLTGALSNWLTNSHTTARVYTKAAVRAMNVWATKCASAIMKERTVTTNVVSMLSAKEPPPASLVRMDRTAPMPMKLDWEASYQVMRLEFDTAIAKLGMEVSNIDVSGLANGKYTVTLLQCRVSRISSRPKQNTVQWLQKLNSCSQLLGTSTMCWDTAS